MIPAETLQFRGMAGSFPSFWPQRVLKTPTLVLYNSCLTLHTASYSAAW